MRLKLIYDIISGIRAIKSYGWEMKLLSRAKTIRNKEIIANFSLNLLRFMTASLLRYAGYISTGLIFFIRTQSGRSLEAGPAFATLGSFSFLSLYVTFYFGEGLIALAELRSSLKRIKSVLHLE